MKKKILVGLVIALTLALGGGFAFAHYWGHGGYGGHMMGFGYGGPMMGPGYGNYMMGPGYEGSCWGDRQATYGEAKPLTEKETASILKNYIGANPNLKVGEIKDKGAYFEGEIVTKDNSLVAKFGIEKNTGWVRPLY